MSEYVTTNSNSPGYSYIEVTNNGGYITRFSVLYDYKGKATVHNSSEFPLLQSDRIYIPNDAILIVVKFEEEAFIGKWVVFNVAFFFKPVTKCYSITGTIVNPKATEIFCNGFNLNNCEVNNPKIKYTDIIR